MAWKRGVREGALGLALLAALAGLLIWPGEVAQAGQEGLALCGNVLLPSLFPFFVVSSLTVSLGLAEYPGRLLERLMGPLFRVRGRCVSALVLGLVGGYPVGARTAAELYKTGQCSRAEAERLLGFCNNAGPAFLLGVVGSGVFGSPRVGLLLMAVHMVSALLVGLIFRFWCAPARGERAARSKAPRVRRAEDGLHPAAVFVGAVRDSCAGVLNVCAFVVLFGVVLRLLELSRVLDALARGLSLLFGPLGLSTPWARRLLGGLLELTNGVASLPPGEAGSVPMAAFLLGWGGVSVHCQTMSVLRESGLSAAPCVVGKLLHGLISAALAALARPLLLGAAEAGGLLAQPLPRQVWPQFGSVLLLSAAGAALLLGLLLRLSAEGPGKRGGNSRRKGV